MYRGGTQVGLEAINSLGGRFTVIPGLAGKRSVKLICL